MQDHEFDTAVRDARPTRALSDSTLRALDSLVIRARDDAGRKPRRRFLQSRAIWLTTFAAAGAVALTAGGVLFADYMNPDVRVPVSYQTSSGTSVSCTFAVRVEGDQPQLREWLGEYDWSTLGQEIYDDAVANPYIAEDAAQTPDEIDRLSFRSATNRAFDALLAEAPNGANAELSAVNDCSGVLR